MKIVIFGYGSIGQRYASILTRYFKYTVCVFRSGKTDVKNTSGLPEMYSWDEVTRFAPDAALITNPTSCHIRTAIRFALGGTHLFIEKPIDATTAGLDELIRVVKKKKIVSYVAYCLRFNPLIRHLRRKTAGIQNAHARIICSSYLPGWRPKTDYRRTYSADSRLGGGVVLDVSHELDYTEYLFGKIKRIEGCIGKISKLDLKCEDFSDILIRCERAFVNLHLNFFSRYHQRSVAIDMPDGSYIRADLLSGKLISGDRRAETIRRYDCGRDKMYIDQLRYFFRNVAKRNTRMMNSLPSAAVLFRKIMGFKHEKKI